MNKKVMVAMSGGIDSAVAALLLIEQGYEVEGAIMAIHSESLGIKSSGHHACFGPNEQDDIREAEKVARVLNIPLHVVDLKEKFKREILDYFISEYEMGKTPNPCTYCNCRIKFGAIGGVLRQQGLEFSHFATGHYVRLEQDPVTGGSFLKKALDLKKDQSYFLYQLPKKKLPELIFPLGNLTKMKVRSIAQRELPFLKKKEESQDFIEGGYHQLFEGYNKPGPIIDSGGKEIGTHRGIVYYTIGQRRGIGVTSPRPLYVIKKDKPKNAIIVGEKEELLGDSLTATELNWLALDSLTGQQTVTARIRYNSPDAPAIIKPAGSQRVKVEFKEKQSAITPGQAVVFYRRDILLGGGIIE